MRIALGGLLSLICSSASVQYQHILDCAPVAKHITGVEVTGYSNSKCFPDNVSYPITENNVEIIIIFALQQPRSIIYKRRRGLKPSPVQPDIATPRNVRRNLGVTAIRRTYRRTNTSHLLELLKRNSDSLQVGKFHGRTRFYYMGLQDPGKPR
jgi:hypothetical protein